MNTLSINYLYIVSEEYTKHISISIIQVKHKRTLIVIQLKHN